MIYGLRDAIVGSGGDASEITKDESRLLAKEISNVCKPKDRNKTKDRIEKSVRRKFSTLGESQKDFGEGKGDVKWYRCDDRYLYGVARDKDMRKASGEDLANVYYASKMIQGKTRIIADFKHPRKKQRVAIVQKILTNKRSLDRAVKQVQLAIGKLSASWLASARKIDPSKSTVAPQWIERHIRGDRTSKSITDISSLQSSESPSVAFGSKAVGVKKFERSIQFAIDLRAKKVAARLKLVLHGYSQDVKNGIKAKRRGGKTP